MTARAGNGKFVSSSNPCAVIGRLNSQVAAARAEAEARRIAAQRNRARKVIGVLTRNELASLASR